MLLDEYDTPFMSANSEGYYDEVRAMLNRFLATSLKGNDYLQKGNSDRNSENCEGKYIFGSQ